MSETATQLAGLIMDHDLPARQEAEIARLRTELATEAEQSKICLDSYAAENQRFSDEIEAIRAELALEKSANNEVIALLDKARAATRQDAEEIARLREALETSPSLPH